MGLDGCCYHGDLAMFASQKGMLEETEIFKFGGGKGLFGWRSGKVGGWKISGRIKNVVYIN